MAPTAIRTSGDRRVEGLIDSDVVGTRDVVPVAAAIAAPCAPAAPPGAGGAPSLGGAMRPASALIWGNGLLKPLVPPSLAPLGPLR
jgi:hypothetical protein